MKYFLPFSSLLKYFILFYFILSLVMYVNHSVHLTFATFSAFNDELFYFFWHLKHVGIFFAATRSNLFLWTQRLNYFILFIPPHLQLIPLSFWNVNKSFVRIKTNLWSMKRRIFCWAFWLWTDACYNSFWLLVLLISLDHWFYLILMCND